MRYFIVSLLILVIVACGGSTGAPGVRATAADQWTPVLPASDLTVGRNRFLLGILDERNRPIVDAKVHLRFFDLSEPQPPLKAEADAIFRGTNLGDKGLYVTNVSFDRAGAWGVEVQASRPDGASRTARVQFEVRAQSLTPAIGAPAIPSKNPTLKDGVPLEKLSTAQRPDPALHQLSIADALAQKKPFVVLFGSPGFCKTATCAPSLEVVQALQAKYGERVNFIHVEIYKDPHQGIVAEAVEQWHLPSEPWLFLVDANGNVAEKLEGGITLEEVEPAVAKLAA
ncbi:MAG: thioredoxin family protein [Chloroflexi bacterium]|nr:thioredoxin family protein [Chloroflexota bacterium]